MNMQAQQMFLKAGLLMTYGAPLVELDKIANDLLGLSPRVAARKAAAGQLPFPVIQLGSSQKSPKFVNLEHLAEWLESLSKESKAEFKAMNTDYS
ncbi:pyocin activator PrtN family protein [Corallincola platygyrae]|uniref:Pyocin activator PrtN family protein n=1 Tax=Corallincola platygyrae TaxID=1193278 RepID=A0ABW4XQ87_9GAMM